MDILTQTVPLDKTRASLTRHFNYSVRKCKSFKASRNLHIMWFERFVLLACDMLLHQKWTAQIGFDQNSPFLLPNPQSLHSLRVFLKWYSKVTIDLLAFILAWSHRQAQHHTRAIRQNAFWELLCQVIRSQRFTSRDLGIPSQCAKKGQGWSKKGNRSIPEEST